MAGMNGRRKMYGHEYGGTVAAIGSTVKRVKIGDRVTGEGHVVGRRSRNARAGRFHLDPDTKGIGVNLPGAFAQYLALPEFNVIPLPESVPLDIAAILDPLGNAVHTTLAFDLVGEDVLITGAGPIGIMAAAVAERAGARRIVLTDIEDWRLNFAKTLTKRTRMVNTMSEDLKTVMSEIGMQEGFDVGLEMSGAKPAFEQMLDTSRQMYETWYKMLALLDSGLDMSNMITHRFPARDWQMAFDLMETRKAGKVILDWSDI